MTERDRLRLAALLGPLLGHLPPHERAEARRLLGDPGPDQFPPSPFWHRPAVAREECLRTADAFPLAHLNADLSQGAFPWTK